MAGMYVLKARSGKVVCRTQEQQESGTGDRKIRNYRIIVIVRRDIRQLVYV
jgi:hypothetical protein